MSNRVFYTYVYLRENNSKSAAAGTPYYIGKGCGTRAFRKRTNEVGKPVDKNKIVFVGNNLSEKDAFQLEVFLIYLYGRLDLGTGVLRNKTDGGEGPSNPSKQTREKLSAWQIGRKHKLESIEKMRLAKKSKASKGPMSEEHKAKISLGNKGKKLSPEHIAKCKLINLGKKVSDETKRRMSETCRLKREAKMLKK